AKIPGDWSSCRACAARHLLVGRVQHAIREWKRRAAHALQEGQGSGDQLLDDLAGDVGEAEVAALEAVGEAGMVEAEEAEDGGVVVVDVDRILGDAPADLVGLADHLAPLDAAAGHPEAEGEGVVVATRDRCEPLAVLAERGPAELGAPED